MTKYEKCLDDIKKLNGIYPYNEFNPCKGDGYFWNDIRKKYPMSLISEAIKECNEIEQKIKSVCESCVNTKEEKKVELKTVEEYSKEMTREEFDKFTEVEELCPSHMGLSDSNVEGMGCKIDCSECWNNSLVGIDFKNSEGVIPYEALNLLSNIEKAEAAYKKLGEERDKFKVELLNLMEKHGVEKWENETVSVSYIKPGIRSSVDSKKLLKEYPEVYSEVIKNSNVKSSVRIKLKGEK